MKNQIPIVVINLAKDKDRRKRISEELTDKNLEFTFFDAVYGAAIPEGEIQKYYNKENSIINSVKPLSKGELGATLSHLKIYQEMLDNEIERMIILEDDAVLTDDFLEALELIDELPSNWEVFLLGYSSNRKYPCMFKVKEKNNFKIGISPNVRGGAFCYAINTRGAKRMLKHKENLYKVIDMYTGDTRLMNVYVLAPRVAFLDDFFISSVTDRDEETLKDWKKKKIIRIFRNWNNSRRKQLIESQSISFSCLIRKLKYKIKSAMRKYEDNSSLR